MTSKRLELHMATYRTRYLPKHHKADILGFVPEHVIIAEETLERQLVKGEIVHHLDWNSVNNSPENLVVMSAQEHREVPELQARFLEAKGLLPEFKMWWRANKDTKDPIRELQQQIAKSEERAMRIKLKLEKQ